MLPRRWCASATGNSALSAAMKSRRVADARVLNILLGDVLVGHLTGFQDGKTLFAFDERYINLGPSRPILSLSFNMPRDEETTERKLREVYSSRMKLPPFFSNLLPEGVLREYMVKRLKIHHDHEFDILMALGGSLPGAIRAARRIHSATGRQHSHRKR